MGPNDCELFPANVINAMPATGPGSLFRDTYSDRTGSAERHPATSRSTSSGVVRIGLTAPGQAAENTGGPHEPQLRRPRHVRLPPFAYRSSQATVSTYSPPFFTTCLVSRIESSSSGPVQRR